jgi:hypothetical protein
VISAEIRRSGELGFLLILLADLLEREGRKSGARMAWLAALERLPEGSRYAAAVRARQEVERRLGRPPE